MKRALAGMAAVAAALGIMACAAPAPEAPKAAPVANVIQEDEPGWDCWTMGNRTCGANPIQRVEAWGYFTPESLTSEVRESAFRVTYRGVALEGTALDAPYGGHVVTYPSSITSGKVHVFEVEVTK
jgi:hypothetical protein